jgi:hypothetical protein
MIVPCFPPSFPQRLDHKAAEDRFFDVRAAMSRNYLHYGPPLIRLRKFQPEMAVKPQVAW